MHRTVRLLPLAVLLSAWSACAQPAPDTDVPVAPVPASPFLGWTNAIVLKNATLEVVVAPALGRVVAVKYKGSNDILRLDKALSQTVQDGSSWLNVGGEWLWPAAQSRWPAFAGSDWPPPPVLAEKEWSARAWKSTDGTENCLMSREYGDPLFLSVSRHIKLDKECATISVRQRIERTQTSSVPVAIWNITQIAGADAVIIPTDSDSAFTGGVKTLLFDMPPSNQLARCEEAVVYDATDGEHKLGGDSKRSWIAARKGNLLIVQQQRNGVPGQHPDGGCTVEMYSNKGLGYTEIETLSVERDLPVGEAIQNSIEIRIQTADPKADPCTLADAVRTLLGERKPTLE